MFQGRSWKGISGRGRIQITHTQPSPPPPGGPDSCETGGRGISHHHLEGDDVAGVDGRCVLHNAGPPIGHEPGPRHPDGLRAEAVHPGAATASLPVSNPSNQHSLIVQFFETEISGPGIAY